MDDELWFRQLSLRAFSYRSLRLLEGAVRTIQSRYPADTGWSRPPNVPPERGSAEEPGPIPRISADWLRYVSGADHTASSSQIAHGEHISEEAMNDCLTLLSRHTPAYAHITEIRQLEKGTNELGDEGLDGPTVIPYRDGIEWAFAVAYPDCIHWYDSRNGARSPCLSARERPVEYGWTRPDREQGGPAAPREDSGIFMLMGIRCIYKGAPHLDQKAAEDMRSDFRALLVVELRCQKIDPSEEEFRALLCQGDEHGSVFFDDALYSGESVQDSPHQVRVAGALSCPPPRVGETTRRPAESRAQQEHISLRDRRMILDFLSEAALASRSTQIHLFASLAVLWELVQRGSIGSTLHARYHAALFHDQMNSLNHEHDIYGAIGHAIDRKSVRKMRDLQRQCKFWSDVCKLRPELGEHRYVLLLSLPPRSVRDEEKAGLLSNLQSRLNDPQDRLLTYLEKSQLLCSSVLFNILPLENLMIDVYRFKRPGEVTDDDFTAFIDLDPRARRAIPRL